MEKDTFFGFQPVDGAIEEQELLNQSEAVLKWRLDRMRQNQEKRIIKIPSDQLNFLSHYFRFERDIQTKSYDSVVGKMSHELKILDSVMKASRKRKIEYIDDLGNATYSMTLSGEQCFYTYSFAERVSRDFKITDEEYPDKAGLMQSMLRYEDSDIAPEQKGKIKDKINQLKSGVSSFMEHHFSGTGW